MIVSQTIKVKKIESFDNLYVEQELQKLGLNFVRWAIIAVDDAFLTVSVSYINTSSHII